ncbi:MAG: hypothetical protein Q4E09_05940 [Eubacteriales bacterium]|nr:hypothetical protein [Eubacteriales bacterium]
MANELVDNFVANLNILDGEIDRISRGADDIKQAFSAIKTIPEGTKINQLASYIDFYGAKIVPGNKEPIKTMNGAEYYGTVSAAQLGTFQDGKSVTGSNFSAACKITDGTAFNDVITWHKFKFNDEVILIAEKPIRYAIAWMHIARAGCVFGQRKLKIGGLNYKVSLLRGMTKEINSSAALDEASEWNRLLVPLISGQYASWGTNKSAADLGIVSGNGGYSWCQETTSESSNSNYRLLIGYSSPVYAYYGSVDSTSTGFGFRPALRFTF